MSAGVAAGTLLAGSTILQAGSQYGAGQAASRNATMVANQLDQNAELAKINAGQQEAVGQQRAKENLRQNRFLQSRIINLAAASGASASTNKNVADLVSKTAGEGEYAALNSLYEGKTRADQLRNEAIGLTNKAMVTRFEGRQTRKAANSAAFSSILGGAAKGASFYSKYNSPAPTDNGAGGSLDSGSDPYESLYG